MSIFNRKRRVFDYELTQVNDTDMECIITYSTTHKTMQFVLGKIKGKLQRRVDTKGVKLIDEWHIPDQHKHLYLPLIKRSIAPNMQTIMNITKNDGYIITTWSVKDVTYKRKDDEWLIIVTVMCIFSKV